MKKILFVIMMLAPMSIFAQKVSGRTGASAEGISEQG